MIWDVLGIHPTNDTDEIKKAYAKLAKQYNPEEYPDEFRRIHDAFKDAMKFAKGMGNVSGFSNKSEIIILKSSKEEIQTKKDVNSESDENYNFEEVFNDASKEKNSISSVNESIKKHKEEIHIKKDIESESDENFNFKEIFKDNSGEKGSFSLINEIFESDEGAKVVNRKVLTAEQVLDELKKIIKDPDLCNSKYVWSSLFSNRSARKVLQNPKYFNSVDKIIERTRFNKSIAEELKEFFGSRTHLVYNYEYDVYYVDITGKRKLEYYTVGALKYKIKNILRSAILIIIVIFIIIMFISASFY